MEQIITFFFIALVALASAPAALHGADAPKPGSKPNILILLADDMGYGDPADMNNST